MKTTQCTKQGKAITAARKGKGSLQQLEQTLGGGNSSDTSTSSKVTTRSSNKFDEDEQEPQEGVRPSEHSAIFVPKYCCKKCIYNIDDINLFYRHYSEVHKKLFMFVESPTVLSGLNLHRVYEVMSKICTRSS